MQYIKEMLDARFFLCYIYVMIPGSVDRTSASGWLYTPMDNMSENGPSTLMTHVVCKSKLLSGVWSSTHPYLGTWVAIGRAEVYYARAAFSALIKCQHCIWFVSPVSTCTSPFLCLGVWALDK